MGNAALRTGEGDASKHPESSAPLLRLPKEAEAVQEEPLNPPV